MAKRNSPASNPNVFRDHFLSEHNLARQMAIVSGRQGGRYGNSPGKASWTTMADQSDSPNDEYTYPFVSDVIRQTMRTKEFEILYDSQATHIAIVRSTVRHELVGAALLEHGTTYLHESKLVDEPSIKILGFGVGHEVGDTKINLNILELLAEQIIAVATTVSNDTRRHRATRLSSRYTPTIEILSHNIMQNTVEAETSNAALEAFATALNKIELTTPKTGGGEEGFGRILELAYSELCAMAKAHPDHAFIQSIANCPHIKQLDMLGGSDAEYETVQKIVTAMLRLIGAIQMGVRNYFGLMHPSASMPNIAIITDGKESTNGEVKLKATSDGGSTSVGSAKFTPTDLDDERPEVVFDMNHGIHVLSELAGGVVDQVTKGSWWNKQIRKK